MFLMSILQCLYIATNLVPKVSSHVTDFNTRNKLLDAKSELSVPQTLQRLF